MQEEHVNLVHEPLYTFIVLSVKEWDCEKGKQLDKCFKFSSPKIVLSIREKRLKRHNYSSQQWQIWYMQYN